MGVDEEDGIRNGAVNQLGEAGGLGSGAEGEREHGDFQILAVVVAEDGHADGGGLERGEPMQLFDSAVDLAFVGGGGCAVFHEQLFRHTLIHPRIGGETERSDDGGCGHAVASGRMTR